RHAIIHERAGDELAVLVVDRALEQRLAYALRDAAVNLALDDHRIDHGAEIIDRGPGDDLAFAGLRIDLDLADVTAGGKGEVGGIVERPFLQSRLQLLAGEFVRDIGVERDLAPGRGLVGARDRELAVLEHDVAFGRLQHVGRDLLRLGLDLVERLHDRGDADRARARAIGAHTELHLVGIAVHDADVVERNAERFGHDLRKGGLVALAVLVTAGEDFDRAGGIDAHFRRFPQPDAAAERADRLARRNPAGLDIGGEADAAQLVVAGGGAGRGRRS